MLAIRLFEQTGMSEPVKIAGCLFPSARGIVELGQSFTVKPTDDSGVLPGVSPRNF